MHAEEDSHPEEKKLKEKRKSVIQKINMKTCYIVKGFKFKIYKPKHPSEQKAFEGVSICVELVWTDKEKMSLLREFKKY